MKTMNLCQIATCTASMLALALASGCSQQAGLQATASDTAEPFARPVAETGISPTGSFASSGIPVGTPITVRLQSRLSSQQAHSGDSFEALLDEPIMVDGQPVAARGARVVGKVLAAKASGAPQDPGYLRLALTTISIQNHTLQVQASSIFAKGGARERRNPAGVAAASMVGSSLRAEQPSDTRADVELSADRRLTFRLTQPLRTRN